MNIVEFAKRAGVSTATISRAFHEPDKLRADTRQHILALAEKLGYYPSPSGRALVRGRHDVLGLIWPLEVEGAESLFAQRTLSLLTDHLVRNDLDLLICPIDRNQPATMAHAQRTLQRSRCDAWILLYPRQNDSFVTALKNAQKPVVCFMGHALDHPAWKSVELNQRTWMTDCLTRLKASGCRRVLFHGRRDDEPDHEERWATFQELAPQFFGNHVSSLSGWPPRPEDFMHEVTTKKIDAVIGVDDSSALNALELCRQAGLSVPEQVKVIGIDDSPQARLSQPPLSTYHPPMAEMVAYTVDLALGRRSRSRRFDAAFVPRDSFLG